MESSLPPWWTKQMDEVFLTLLSSQPAARTGLNLRSGQAPAPAPATEWRTAAQLAEVQLDRGTFLPEFQGLRDVSHLDRIDQLARSPSPTPMAASAGQQQRQLQAAPNGQLKAMAPSGAKLAKPASEKLAGQGERKGPRARDSTAQPAKKVAAAAAQPAKGAGKAGVGKQEQKPAGSNKQGSRLQDKPAGLAVGSDASKEQSAAGMSHQHHKADAGATANGGHAGLKPECQAKGQGSSTAAAKPGRRIKVKIGGKVWNQATGDKKANPKAADGSASPMAAALREVQGAGAANLPGKALLPKLPEEWLIKAQNAADVRASAEAARTRAAETAERPLPSGAGRHQQQAPELPKHPAKAGKKAARAARAGKPAHAEGPRSSAAAGQPETAQAAAKGEAVQEGQAAAAAAVTDVFAELTRVGAEQASVAAVVSAEPVGQAGSVPRQEAAAAASAKPKAAGKLAQRKEVAVAPSKASLPQHAQQQRRHTCSQEPAHTQASAPAQTAVRQEPANQSSRAQSAPAAPQEPAKVLDKAQPAAAGKQDPARVSSKAPAEVEARGPAAAASATQSAATQPAAAVAAAPEAPPAAKPAGGRLTGLLRGVTKSGPRLTVKLPVKLGSQPEASGPNGGDAAPVEPGPAAAAMPAEQQQAGQQAPAAKAAEPMSSAERASAKEAPAAKLAEVAAAAEHLPAEGAPAARAVEPTAGEGQAALLTKAAKPTTSAEESAAPMEPQSAKQERQPALSVGSRRGTEGPREQIRPKGPEVAAALLDAGAKQQGLAGPAAAGPGVPAAVAERSAASAAAVAVPAAADVGAKPLTAPAKAEARSLPAREAGAAAAQQPESQPVAPVAAPAAAPAAAQQPESQPVAPVAAPAAAPAPAQGEAAGEQTSKAAAQEGSARSLRPVAPLTVEVPTSAIDAVSPAEQEARQRPASASVEQQVPPPVAPVVLPPAAAARATAPVEQHVPPQAGPVESPPQAVARAAAAVEQQLPPPVTAVVSPPQATARVAVPVEQQLPPPVAPVESPPAAAARAIVPVEQQLPPPVAAVVSPLTAGALPSVQAPAQPAPRAQAPPAAAGSEPAAPGTEVRVGAQHEGRQALPRTARGSGAPVAAGQAVKAQPTPPAGVRTVDMPGQPADKAKTTGLPEPVTCTAGQPGAVAAAHPEVKQAVAAAPAIKGSKAVAAGPTAKQAGAVAPAAQSKGAAAAPHGRQAAATSAGAKHPETPAAANMARQVQPAALAAAVGPKPSTAQAVAAPARHTTKLPLKGKLSFGLKSPVKRVLAVNCLKDSRAAGAPQAEPQAAAAAASHQQAAASAPSQLRPEPEPSQQPQRALDRLMSAKPLAETEAKTAEPGLRALGQQRSTSSIAEREPTAAQQPPVSCALEPGPRGPDRQRSSSFAGRESGSQEPRRDGRRRSRSPPARRESSVGRRRGPTGRRGSTESSSRSPSSSYTSSGSEPSSPSSSPSPVRHRQQEPPQGRLGPQELSHGRHRRREPSHGRHRRDSSLEGGRQYKRQRSSPRYSSSRSLSPRRSSSGFSRLRSDYSDRRRSPVEGRAASSGSTDSPGANKQRAAPAPGQQGPPLERQPSVRSRLAESSPAGSGAAELQPREGGRRGRQPARGGAESSAAGRELGAGSAEVQPAAGQPASKAAVEGAAAPAVERVPAAPAAAAPGGPATGVAGPPAAAARPAPFRMKLVKAGRISIKGAAPAGVQGKQGPAADPQPQTQQQPAEAAAVQGLRAAAEEDARGQAAGEPAQAEGTGAAAEQGAVSGQEGRGTSPPADGAEGQRFSAESGPAAQLQQARGSEQRQPAKPTKAADALRRRSVERGNDAARPSAERGAPQQDPDRAGGESKRRPAQPSRAAARSSAERPGGELKGQPTGPGRAAGPPKRRRSASPEAKAPAKRQRAASPGGPASPTLSPKERLFAALSREDQERVRQYRAIKDPELPSMWLNPEPDYEKMFGISPPAPTPPSQAPLQPEQEALPVAPGFQPSEGSTFSPIYGSTPGHLARVKPAGVKLDKDRLRAQRMLNLETKGSGQQQQQRPLQQPASEPGGEAASRASGHQQQQQRPPHQQGLHEQQLAQGPAPVPATATPHPPAAAVGRGPCSDQAASHQTGSGAVPPAGQPAAGAKPAAAQRPLRAGKPPVPAAAAAARPQGQTGTTRPPAEAKAALGPKRRRGGEGPAPAAGAVSVASGPGTSQQPEKMRKAVPAGGVVPHAVPCFEADLCQLSKLTAADPKLLTMDSAKVHEEGRQLKQFASKQRDASGKGHTATGIYYMLQACLKFIHAAGLVDGLGKGPAQPANVRVAAQYEDIARLLDMVLGQIRDSELPPLKKQGFKLTTERLLSVMLLRGLQATRHPLKACRTGLIDLLPEDVQTAIRERMPATVTQGARQSGPPQAQALRRTSPDSNTSASTPMDAGSQLMPSGGATASQAPAATGTRAGTPAPTGSGGGATPITAGGGGGGGGGGASAGGSASAGSNPVKLGHPRAAGHVESTAQRAQDRPDIILPGWMQEDQARLLSAQRSMQVLLDTTATNVLDLYAFQEKAAQKGDAAAEAAGSFMLFLNSDCIVDFRRILQIGHKVVDSVKNIQH